MGRRGRYEVAVLGAGPAGIAAAIVASRTQRVVLVADQLPCGDAPPWVEHAPMWLLRALEELDVAAEEVGASIPEARRRVAWSDASPEWIDAQPHVHIARPTLEVALFAKLMAQGRVAVERDTRVLRVGRRLHGRGWTAERWIDAGAASGVVRVGPRRRWIGKLYGAPAKGASPEMAVAMLPGGYAFRVGTERELTVGVVGELGRTGIATHQRMIEAAGASWILEGLPPLRHMPWRHTVRGSLEWADPGAEIRVGDAAFARDPLTSQGQATSIADAFYAAGIDSEEAAALYHRRIARARLVHTRDLHALAVRGLHRATPAWSRYRAFLDDHRGYVDAEAAAILRGANDRPRPNPYAPRRVTVS